MNVTYTDGMIASFGVLGAGAQADEAIDYAAHRPLAFRAVTAEFLSPSDDDLINIDTDESALLDIEVVAAVGDPRLRRMLVDRWRGSRFTSVIHPAAIVSPRAKVASGAIIAPTAVLSTNVKVGEHAIINIGASLSHDSQVGRFVTLSPGVRISGWCQVGDDVFFGVNASVIPRVRIAAGVIVGAGAVVIDDLIEPGTYVGVPARRVRGEAS